MIHSWDLWLSHHHKSLVTGHDLGAHYFCTLGLQETYAVRTRTASRFPWQGNIFLAGPLFNNSCSYYLFYWMETKSAGLCHGLLFSVGQNDTNFNCWTLLPTAAALNTNPKFHFQWMGLFESGTAKSWRIGTNAITISIMDYHFASGRQMLNSPKTVDFVFCPEHFKRFSPKTPCLTV